MGLQSSIVSFWLLALCQLLKYWVAPTARIFQALGLLLNKIKSFQSRLNSIYYFQTCNCLFLRICWSVHFSIKFKIACNLQHCLYLYDQSLTLLPPINKTYQTNCRGYGITNCGLSYQLNTLIQKLVSFSGEKCGS